MVQLVIHDGSKMENVVDMLEHVHLDKSVQDVLMLDREMNDLVLKMLLCEHAIQIRKYHIALPKHCEEVLQDLRKDVHVDVHHVRSAVAKAEFIPGFGVIGSSIKNICWKSPSGFGLISAGSGAAEIDSQIASVAAEFSA